MFNSTSTERAESALRTHPPVASRGLRLCGKRVAMVTFSPYPVDPRVRRAVQALVEEGMRVDLVCLGTGCTRWHERFAGVEVIRIPLQRENRAGKLSYAYRYGMFILVSSLIFALRTLIVGYDLVYVHNMPDILVLTSLLPKALGAKVVLDLHDPMPELMMTIFGAARDSKSVRLLKRLERWSMARANVVLTVNLACKRIFASRSCHMEKIEVVMNSPDAHIFPFRRAQRRGFTNQDPNRRFVIMYHGSLVERNGLDLAVDALERVRKTFPAAELRVYGPRTPFLDHVMTVVRSKNLHEVVHYHGQKRLEELVPEIENCDVGVIPNHCNAFTEINTPTRIFEYLALGKPVIVPSTPGIQDYFDGESLLFFEPGNSQELAQQIEMVLAHPSEVMGIVQRGQEVYLAHTWQREKQTLLRCVSEILNGRSLT